MANKFVTAHAGAKKVDARVKDIFAIKQSPGEGLREFLARFNRKWFKGNKKVIKSAYEVPPMTWDEIHNAYCAKVRAAEDDLNGLTHRLTSVQAESRKYRRNDIIRDIASSRPNRERHLPYVRTSVTSSSHHEEGPPLSRTGTHRNKREIVYALEKLGPKVKWSQKMRSDPNTRRSDALYEFHQERGHKIEDCIALRQEIVNMMRQGHLKELLSDQGRTNFVRGREQHQGPPKLPSSPRSIHMIIDGGDDASINGVKFTTTHKLKSITHKRYDKLEESIIFNKSDANDTDVRRIMVDDGSAACIIHPRVLAQMKPEDKIVSYCITLTGFNIAVERTYDEITLSVLAGGVTLETTFHIMDHDTTYNAIIGRSWIYTMRAIPSNLYQVIKFPTSWGIFSIRGE
uniref:Retrotransposon gag domain-containing protein n=1 Tax=Nicotiana tabacum TaxID=4097 RepID=A0A1S4DKQ0_TOBAC|nr:PREDICTED: uncharacterized protein LOC107830744 [Nicotiana tabacum]